MNEIVETESGGIVGMADTDIIRIAEQAEKRIEAMKKIKNTAIMLTNEGDWVDQGGKPYLQASGAEKIAGAFGINWFFLTSVPDCEEEDDGHYTYTYHGRFTMAGRNIEIDGSRSSRDPFFKQYKYVKQAGNAKDVRVEKDLSERDNKRDVKMAALTNLLGNGITRMLGIRNMSYADLLEYAGIKQENLGKVSYGKDKPPVQKTKSKSATETKTAPAGDKIVTTIGNIVEKDGKKPHKLEGEGKVIYSTYSDSFATLANTAMESGLKVEITTKGDQYNTIETIELVEDEATREPGQEG